MLILATTLSLAPLNAVDTNCECGSHSTGITGYRVQKGAGCCSGVPRPQAVVHYYVRGQGSTWEHDRTESVEGTVAQANCCDPS